MKIFVAGATGTLGWPLVRALVARGHHVTGLTRSPAKRKRLEKAGAAAAVADALDARALEEAVRSAAPDCVVHLLTAIPKKGPLRPADLRATNRLRTSGTANLLQAAQATGARRLVGESMVFAYGFGDHGRVPKRESDALQEREEQPWLQETVDALRALEEQLVEADRRGRIEAIPLRYGLLYGPEAPSTRSMLRMLRRRMVPTVRGVDGLASWVHVEDAVSATVAAVERGRPGETYNVVDDEPTGMNEWIAYAATLIGAKRPFSIPLWLIRRVLPYVAVLFSTRLPVDNEKAKRDLGWAPQFPSYREGLRQVVAQGSEEE